MIIKTVLNTSVTEQEVKKQLNIEESFTDDDAYIKTLINAATDFISGQICADVETTECTVKVHDNLSIVHNAPFQELISVINSNNEDVATGCSVVAVHTGFTIKFPATDNYKIEWKSGYAKLPPALKQAIIIKAADLYEPERASYTNTVNASPTKVIDSLIGKYKREYWG